VLQVGFFGTQRLRSGKVWNERKERGGDAFMVIEIDDSPGEDVRDRIRALPWVRWAFRLDKVSA